MRKALSNVMFSTQMALGWCFPNAIMQYAVPDLDSLSIDLTPLTRRRDLLAATLTKTGYEVLLPDGTFYLWAKWPEGNPEAHWNRLADRNIFVLPGSVMSSVGSQNKQIAIGKSKFDRYSPKAIDLIADAIKKNSIDDIWKVTAPAKVPHRAIPPHAACLSEQTHNC